MGTRDEIDHQGINKIADQGITKGSLCDDTDTRVSDPTAAIVKASPCAYRLLSLRIIMAESFVLHIFPDQAVIALKYSPLNV